MKTEELVNFMNWLDDSGLEIVHCGGLDKNGRPIYREVTKAGSAYLANWFDCGVGGDKVKEMLK